MIFALVVERYCISRGIREGHLSKNLHIISPLFLLVCCKFLLFEELKLALLSIKEYRTCDDETLDDELPV